MPEIIAGFADMRGKEVKNKLRSHREKNFHIAFTHTGTSSYSRWCLFSSLKQNPLGGIMPRIVLCCAAGMSTSMLVNKMKPAQRAGAGFTPCGGGV
jgi:hypothetical protein